MDKKYCSYCNYFDMDTSRFPIRYTCVLHKVRIVKDEQAEQCPDFIREGVRRWYPVPELSEDFDNEPA